MWKNIFFAFFCVSVFSACDTVLHDNVVVIDSLSLDQKVESQQNNTEVPSSYLTSKILDPQFYEQAFRVAEKKWDTRPVENTRIVVVNHHLLAPHLIADTLKAVNPDEIENIILLSPNHFSQGNDDILFGDFAWKTPFGALSPVASTSLIHRSLSGAEGSMDNRNIFQNEHGVSGLVGFLKYQFPDAKLLSIIQKDSASAEKSYQLAEQIYTHFSKENTLIVLSIDVSHDLFPQISEFHDVTTIESFLNFDVENFQRLDVDSVPSLRTVFSLAEKWNMIEFQLLHHTNSAEITEQEFQPDTTSYVTGYFRGREEAECAFIETELSCLQSARSSQKATALFLGDLMLDRYIRQKLDAHGWEYLLDWRMKRFMRGSDLTVVNFEGAMTTFDPYPAHDMMLSFTSDPKWAKNMAEYGINVASLGNNHSLNFGREGLEQTRKFLAEEGIETFGEPFNKENLSVIQKVRGITIGLVSYHELFDGNPRPVLDEIEKIREQVDFVVVYAHWGDEYISKIHPRPQKKAHQFVDAGADIVIGHHPHVVQPMEEYNGKYIFYSLGNFVFDQANYESVRTRLGLGVVFECENACTEKNISYSLFPLVSNINHQVRLMDEEEQKSFFEWFERISE